MDGLRATAPAQMYDLASQVEPAEQFYAKLAHASYRAEPAKSIHMYSDIHHYSDTLHTNTPGTLVGVPEADRRVLYERRLTGHDHLDIWIPYNRDNNQDVPIYIVFRGTSDTYDAFVDFNMLQNHYGLGQASFSSPEARNVFFETETQFMNEVNAVLQATTEKVVFVSHSLGSEFALHIWHWFHNYPGNIYADRLVLNQMFNPFIVVDDVFTASLSQPDTYKNKLHASIVDSDIFASIYKNHPIGPIKVYGDLVLENTPQYYSYNAFIAAQLSWLQYLDLRNHRIISFLGDDTAAYPSNAYIHYIPEQTNPRMIQTRRTFGIHINESVEDANNQYVLEDEYIDGQHLQLRLDKSEFVHAWRLSNININSHSDDLTEFDMSIAYSGEPHLMIYKSGKWSLPLIINQDNNYERHYIFQSLNPLQPTNPLYYFARVATNTLYYLKPYSNIAGQDYTWYLTRQKDEDTPAYQLVTQEQFVADFTFGTDSLHHKNYEWEIVPPQIPTHSGYLGGQRRSIDTTTFVNNRLSLLHQPQLTSANCTIATMPQLNDQGGNSTFYLVSFLADWVNWSDPNLVSTFYDTTIYTTGQNETLGVTGFHGTYSNAEPPFPDNVNIDENTWTLQRTSVGTNHDSYTLVNTETNAPIQGNGLIAPTGSYLIIEPDITQNVTGTSGLAYVHIYMLKPDGTKHYFHTRNRNPWWCNVAASPLGNQSTAETFVITNVNLSSTIVSASTS